MQSNQHFSTHATTAQGYTAQQAQQSGSALLRIKGQAVTLTAATSSKLMAQINPQPGQLQQQSIHYNVDLQQGSQASRLLASNRTDVIDQQKQLYQPQRALPERPQLYEATAATMASKCHSIGAIAITRNICYNIMSSSALPHNYSPSVQVSNALYGGFMFF
uniref:Uncharacterized protein n=1 Tax=Populus alba TaxID=43335 RepID=A0A4U5P1N3_POPAL|nr:hypothetical protein D5086_0000238660 [Populus alba]